MGRKLDSWFLVKSIIAQGSLAKSTWVSAVAARSGAVWRNASRQR